MMNDKRVSKRAALVALGMITLMGCSDQKAEEEPVTQSLSTDEQIEWTEDLESDSLQGQAMFEDILDTFEEGYDDLEDEQKERAVDTLVYSVQNQVNRLNSVSGMFAQEIYDMMDEYPDVDFKTGENSEQLPEGVVRGLLSELGPSYARLVSQSSGQLVVGIDDTRLKEEFKDSMSPETVNRVELARFEQEHSLVDHENGHLDFDTIWKGLDLIESLNADTDELAMQNELPRFFYYRALLGYEEISMEDENGNVNETAIAAMEALIDEHPEHSRSEDLTRLIAAIRDEGVYGEQSHKVADDILEERFETIYAEMSEELGLTDTEITDEPDTDPNVNTNDDNGDDD